jgi:hypothetical protein
MTGPARQLGNVASVDGSSNRQIVVGIENFLQAGGWPGLLGLDGAACRTTVSLSALSQISPS